MPLHDWQFWITTLAALAGLFALVRPFFASSDPDRPACGGCATGAAACAKRPATSEATGSASPLVVLPSRSLES